MNSTIKTVAKVEELNQSNVNSDTKKGRHSTHTSKIMRVPKEKNGNTK